MSQPSYESVSPTPTVPTDVHTQGGGNIVAAQDVLYDSQVASQQSALSGMTVPGPGHPAYGGNAGQGALGYLGFNDAELGQINNNG